MFANQFLWGIKFRELENQVQKYHTVLYSNDNLWFHFASFWDSSCLLPQRCQKPQKCHERTFMGKSHCHVCPSHPWSETNWCHSISSTYPVLISSDQDMVNMFSLPIGIRFCWTSDTISSEPAAVELRYVPCPILSGGKPRRILVSSSWFGI